MTKKIEYSTADVDAIRKLYESGSSFKKISTELGFSAGKIRKIALENDIKPRPSGGKVTYSVADAMALFDEGSSIEEIAAEFGVHRNSVYEQLRKYNADGLSRTLVDRTLHKQLVEAGMSDVDIAEQLDCSLYIVARIRTFELGIKRPRTK